MSKVGRPTNFDTEEAWDIYLSLPEEEKSFSKVANILSDRYDKPISFRAIKLRFKRAKLLPSHFFVNGRPKNY